MEYIYSAMLLHKAGQPINEANVTKVLTAAGVKVDANRVKAVCAAVEGLNIEEAISTRRTRWTRRRREERREEGRKEVRRGSSSRSWRTLRLEITDLLFSFYYYLL